MSGKRLVTPVSASAKNTSVTSISPEDELRP
jgi:hypothetical protein